MFIYIYFLNLKDHSVHAPIAMYPLNGDYTTKEKDDQQLPGKPGNGASLAEGPDGRANSSYQFHGTEDSYIEFPNNAGGLDAQHSITMLCWVYISNSSSCPGPLFIYYNKTNSDKHFGMAIESSKLAVYFTGNTFAEIQSGTLELNHWHYVGASYDHKEKEVRLWVNGTIVEHTKPFTGETLATGYRAVRMGAVFLKIWNKCKTLIFKGRISAMQVYNVSLSKQQIEAVKYFSGRGKNMTSKEGVF